MPKLIALWTAPDDVEGFTADYTATHARLVRSMPELTDAFFGTSLGGPYARIAKLTWSSGEDMNAALGSPQGAELMADTQRLQETFGNRVDVLIVNED